MRLKGIGRATDDFFFIINSKSFLRSRFFIGILILTIKI